MAFTTLIVGATSDIARALAHQLAVQGHTLLLAARNQAVLEADAADLRIRHQVEVQTILWEASDLAGQEAWVAQLPVLPDWVIWAAGYLGEQEAQQQSWKLAEQAITVNYTAAAAMLLPLANRFEQRGSGVIVGISSVAGDRGRASNYFYGSAKAGFSALLSGLRNRLTPQGVQVLTVKPGFVRTRMTEGMDLPPLLTADPDAVAKDILRAIRKKRPVIYTKWMWRYVMLIVKLIPEGIFLRLKL